MAGLARGDVLVVWEDDDIYLPWHITAQVEALANGGFSKLSRVLSLYTGELREEKAAGRFHASIAITRETLDASDGCPLTKRGDFDQTFPKRLAGKARTVDPCRTRPPSYVFRWGSTRSYHGQALMHGPHRRGTVRTSFYRWADQRVGHDCAGVRCGIGLRDRHGVAYWVRDKRMIQSILELNAIPKRLLNWEARMNRNNRFFLPVVFASVILFAESRTASADDSVRLPAMPEMEFKIRWSLSSVAFSPNGKYLASANDQRGVDLWHLKSRAKVWEVALPPVGTVSEEDVALTFTTDGKMTTRNLLRALRILGCGGRRSCF